MLEPTTDDVSIRIECTGKMKMNIKSKTGIFIQFQSLITENIRNEFQYFGLIKGIFWI